MYSRTWYWSGWMPNSRPIHRGVNDMSTGQKQLNVVLSIIIYDSFSKLTKTSTIIFLSSMSISITDYSKSKFETILPSSLTAPGHRRNTAFHFLQCTSKHQLYMEAFRILIARTKSTGFGAKFRKNGEPRVKGKEQKKPRAHDLWTK